MADDDRNPTVEGEPTAEPAAPRSRSAAAQAASRARRIGGARPTRVGRPRPGPDPSEADAPDGGAPGTGAIADVSVADSGAAARPETRTRVAGRRPLPGPRTESESEDEDAPTRTATRSSTRGAGGRAVQPPPAATSARPVWLRWLPAAVAAALVVALAIVDVVMLQNWRDQPNRAERREKLVASVNVAVTKIMSYDYRHLDQDEAAASSRQTGKFRDDYVQSMNSAIKKKALSEKAVVVGEVSSTAITSVSGDGKQAVLLVLGQQTITNTKQTTPRNDLVQLRVTAQLVHGKWLVSDLASL